MRVLRVRAREQSQPNRPGAEGPGSLPSTGRSPTITPRQAKGPGVCIATLHKHQGNHFCMLSREGPAAGPLGSADDARLFWLWTQCDIVPMAGWVRSAKASAGPRHSCLQGRFHHREPWDLQKVLKGARRPSLFQCTQPGWVCPLGWEPWCIQISWPGLPRSF